MVNPDGPFPFESFEAKAIYGIVLRFIELLILIASIIATYFHFYESGKTIGDVTRFHFAHTIWSASFWGVNIGTALYFSRGDLTSDIDRETGRSKWIKDCSWNFVWYNMFNVFREYAMYLFFNYWEAVYVQQNRLRFNLIRRNAYGLCIVLFLISNFFPATYHTNNCPKNIYLMEYCVYYFMDMIIFIDCCWLFYWFWFHTKEEIIILYYNKTWNHPSLQQFILFVLLLICYFLALFLETIELIYGASVGTPFNYAGFTPLVLTFNIVIPSLLVLLIMWKREYFKIDADIEFEFSIAGSSFRSTEFVSESINYTENRMSGGGIHMSDLSQRSVTSVGSSHQSSISNHKDTFNSNDSLPFKSSSSGGSGGGISSVVSSDLGSSMGGFSFDQYQDDSIFNDYGEDDEGEEDDDDDDDVDKDDEDYVGREKDVLDGSDVTSSYSMTNTFIGDVSKVPKELRRAFLKATPLEATHTINITSLQHQLQVEVEPKKMLEISEDLRPPSVVAAVFMGYLKEIALPELQLAFQKYSIVTAKLIEACDPSSSSASSSASRARNAATFEREKQFQLIQSKCNYFTSKFTDHVNVLNSVLSHLKSLGNNDDRRVSCLKRTSTSTSSSTSSDHQEPSPNRLLKRQQHQHQHQQLTISSTYVSHSLLKYNKHLVYKPSAQKKCFSLLLFPTNLQIHHTVFKISSKPQHHNDQSLYFPSITIGAPSAHALKYKYGGLRKLKHILFKLKLKKEEKKKEFAGKRNSSSAIDPLDVMKEAELNFAVTARETAVICQALGGAVAGVSEVLQNILRTRDEVSLIRIARVGFLLHSVSLLSTRGKELFMIDDFAGAYDVLNVKIRIANNSIVEKLPSPSSSPSSSTSSTALSCTLIQVIKVEQTSKTDRIDSVCSDLKAPNKIGDITVTMFIDSEEYSQWLFDTLKQNNLLTNESNVNNGDDLFEFMVTPCLFNLGVNEQQTVANAMGTTSMQTEVNLHGFKVMSDYYQKWSSFDEANQSKAGKLLPPLLKQLKLLIETEARLFGKTVDLLLVSCWCARLLGAARTTSCKSAKDRTSVFQTLEIAKLVLGGGVEKVSEQWLQQRTEICEIDLSNHNMGTTEHSMEKKNIKLNLIEQELIDKLRSMDGVRLRNCKLNTGKAKYCFNKFQIETLPQELRPLPNTTGGNKS